MVRGERIKEMRKLKNLTQDQLAKKAGLSMMSIRRYETGARQPNEVDLQNIADALDTSIEYLLGQTSYSGKIVIDEGSITREGAERMIERAMAAIAALGEAAERQIPWAEFYKKYGFKSDADLAALFDDFDDFLRKYDLTRQRFYEMLDDLSKLLHSEEE